MAAAQGNLRAGGYRANRLRHQAQVAKPHAFVRSATPPMSSRTSHTPQRHRWITRLAVLSGAAALATSALAQGGPPMVTDDPGTPGDGHWEINIGSIATHSPGRWTVAA